MMSLITKCPACATMFKVVPDQLRVSEGWVRCGKCSEVFDANAHLLSGSTPVAKPPSPTPAAQPSASDIDWGPLLSGTNGPEPVTLDSAALPKDLPQDLSQDLAQDFSQELSQDLSHGLAEDFAQESAAPAQAPPAKASPAKTPTAPASLQAEPVPDPFMDKSPKELVQGDPLSAANRTTGADTDTSRDNSNSKSSNSKSSNSSADSPVLADYKSPSFMRTRVPTVKKRGLWLSAALVGTVAGVMGVLLLVQVMLHGRNYLAAAYPVLKSPLEALCLVAQCKIEAPQQIEAVVIDGSSLVQEHKAGLYRVRFTLKNKGSVLVAMPAMELSLTDAQEQVLVRKVLLATQLGAAQNSLKPGEEVEFSLPLQLQTASLVQSVAGYRLLAFYP